MKLLSIVTAIICCMIFTVFFAGPSDAGTLTSVTAVSATPVYVVEETPSVLEYRATLRSRIALRCQQRHERRQLSRERLQVHGYGSAGLGVLYVPTQTTTLTYGSWGR